MRFIENSKAERMLSVLINTNLSGSCPVNKVKKNIFFHQVHVFAILKNRKINILRV